MSDGDDYMDFDPEKFDADKDASFRLTLPFTGDKMHLSIYYKNCRIGFEWPFSEHEDLLDLERHFRTILTKCGREFEVKRATDTLDEEWDRLDKRDSDD